MILNTGEVELQEMARSLRDYLEGFLSNPTGNGCHFLRNKIAEYYSVSQARAEEAYQAEQERLRRELGIEKNKEVA